MGQIKETSRIGVEIFGGIFAGGYIGFMHDPFPSQTFEVRPDPESKGLGVFATTTLKTGTRIGFFTGLETPVRSQMSLQFGSSLFIEPGEKEPFRNLNHACSPSARFTGRDLHASKDLKAGDAITIDYTLHEEEMAVPFRCKCGSPECLGRVQGWRFLSPTQKAERRNQAGDWLKFI